MSATFKEIKPIDLFGFVYTDELYSSMYYNIDSNNRCFYTFVYYDLLFNCLLKGYNNKCMYVCVCMCACVRACVRVGVCSCVRPHVQ